jgi:hypothetical protein
MYIGGGIFLLVVGAVLAFGINDSVESINLEAVGWIFMGGGVLAILLSLVLGQQRSNTTHTEVVERRGDVGGPPIGY